MTPLQTVLEAITALFLLQGVAIPFVLLVSGWLWWTQEHRLDRLQAEHAEPPKRSKRRAEAAHGATEAALQRLPALQPLNCRACGAGVLLREADTECPNCGARGALPADYVAIGRTRADVRDLLRSARRHWRVANVLTHPVVKWAFLFLVFAEPLILLPGTLIATDHAAVSPINQALEGLGEEIATLIVGPALLASILWMVIFLMLWNLSRELRRELPAVPVFAGAPEGREVANCRACGGGFEYEAGSFAAVCDYCHVPNARVQFARRERVRAEGERSETRSALFGALEIIKDVNATLFFSLGILSTAGVLLFLLHALFGD